MPWMPHSIIPYPFVSSEVETCLLPSLDFARDERERPTSTLGLFPFRHRCAELRGPARHIRLPPARDGKRVGLHVHGDDRSRADNRAAADLDGRDQRAVGADECACAYFRAVFQERSEEHTSELQSLMRISYAVFC